MEKVKLPKEVGLDLDEYKEDGLSLHQVIADLITCDKRTAGYPKLADWYYHLGGASERLALLVDAWRYGWEDAEKPKRYVLPMPGTEYHNIQMRGNAQYYAIKGTENWRPDAIALGTDNAVKHGYTVTQSEIDTAPGWVKTITPVEVKDDAD